MKQLYLAFISFLIASCHYSQAHAPASEAGTAGTVAPPAIDWQLTDSAEYIYFPDPAHQKNYQVLWVNDRALLHPLLANLERPTRQKQVCAHNAKLYLFQGGAVYKTIYVSDTCQYLAYARNSHQNFIELAADAKAVLDSLQKVARKKLLAAGVAGI